MNVAIAIRNIRASGRHGALPGERDEPQPFDLVVELDVDLSLARTRDDLADTVDYGSVHARVVALVAQRSFRLLERLGDEIVAELMGDPRVRSARVSIAKPRLLDGATPVVVLRSERSAP